MLYTDFMTKHKKNKKQRYTQSSSDLPRTFVGIGLITTCIIIVLFIFIGPGILFGIALLLEGLRTGDVFAQPILLTNCAIIIGLSIVIYLTHRHLKRRELLIPALIALTVLAGMGIVFSTKILVPIYRESRVAESKDKINKYLEKKYKQEFNVYDVRYELADHLGDDTGITASANLVHEPDIEFIVKEKPHASDGVYIDYFLENYNNKYTPENTANFSKALSQLMGDKYTGSTNISHSPFNTALDKTASVQLQEEFNRSNYEQYRQSLRTIGDIVDSIGLKEYNVSIRTEDSNDQIYYGNFFCGISPNERVSEVSFNQAFNTCVEGQERRLEGLYPTLNK